MSINIRKISVFGTITEDIVKKKGRIVERTLGGAPFFFCEAGKEFGVEIYPVSTVGRADINLLKDYQNVNPIGLKEVDRTTRIIVSRSTRAARVENIPERVDVSDLPPEVFAVDVVAVSTLSDEYDAEKIISKARESATEPITALDVQGLLRKTLSEGVILRDEDKFFSEKARSVLAKVDVLKCNEYESEVIDRSTDVKQRAKNISKLGPSLVIITRGEKGCVIFDKENEKFIEQRAEDFLERTLEAGDLFFRGISL